jgi:hypothetical protein
MITEAMKNVTIVNIATQFGVTQLCRLFQGTFEGMIVDGNPASSSTAATKWYNKVHKSESKHCFGKTIE